jgi:23S rRNA (cytidine1920-2'-O)/16S rRNA (cytidine1409-2'-O)-methyltransferase
MAERKRLDVYLAEKGLAPSRSRAQAMIMAGLVLVDGHRAHKPGHLVPEQARVEVKGPEHPYVSRGGVKLAGALDHFKLDPKGWNCLDIGASTGGFSDCLLQRDAGAISAVDVGYGQLAWKLRQDSRVTVYERVNARNLPDQTAPGPFDLVVVDVSFISLTLVLPPLFQRLKPGARLLCLVKPQFEAGREKVGAGGVVRNQADRRATVEKIERFLSESGLEVQGVCPSPIQGPAGNKEYFVLSRRPLDAAGPDN